MIVSDCYEKNIYRSSFISEFGDNNIIFISTSLSQLTIPNTLSTLQAWFAEDFGMPVLMVSEA